MKNALKMYIQSISIHTPRVGSDLVKYGIKTNPGISIHTPRVGSDGHIHTFIRRSELFQSTLPVWGVTRKDLVPSCHKSFQSTLPVWGVTL